MSHRTVSQREKGRKWKKLTENCYMVGRLAKAVLSSSGVRITQNEKKKRKSSCLCLVRARRKFKEHIKNHLFQILEAICLFLRNSSRWKRPCAWQQWVGKQTTYRFCSCENIYRQRMTVFAIIFFFLRSCDLCIRFTITNWASCSQQCCQYSWKRKGGKIETREIGSNCKQ